MSRWRIAVVIVLVGAPLLVLAGVGSWYLLITGWWRLVWIGLMLSMSLGYVLGWYWQRQRSLLRPPEFDNPLHWTERDHEAWKLVEKRARAGANLPPERMSEIPFYVSTAQDLAQELASFYNPGATDPVGALTIPEILAVVELASADLSELVDHHLPGGHLLSINDWKRARQAVTWYQTASRAYWIGAALLDPVTTGLRWIATQVGITTPLQALQNHLYLWFYTAYIHRVGTYLIDLNSGRLRVGAKRYRELARALEIKAIQADEEKAQVAPGTPTGLALADDPDAAANVAIDQVGQLTITLVGQVKAGKSSVANALLGEQRARTDVLPATNGVDRYELKMPEIPTKLVLLDTVGYAHTGPREDQLAETREAVRGSDLVLLVLHARNPGRQADLKLLEDLRDWFSSHPDLRRPPILAVLTHIDLLPPALEWDPPYQLDPPIGAKAVNIHDALGTVQDQLGDFLSGAVPLCAAPGKVYGVDEWLLPAVANRLDEIRGVALLRCLRAEANKERIRRVFRQLMATGKKAAMITWDGLKKELGIGQGKKG
jgi:predicted GTPase